MIRAVIFDMFETLITHYHSPLYFGTQMAEDVGIPDDRFQSLWRSTEYERTIGKVTLEEVLERILRHNQCYSKDLLDKIVKKRIATKEDCFSEEAEVIRRSELFPYFDAVYLSYEQGVQKPDEEIYRRCMDRLGVKPEECLYIGDGGSNELETAIGLGMKAVQAAWYLQEGTMQPSGRKVDFEQIERPMDMLKYVVV